MSKKSERSMYPDSARGGKSGIRAPSMGQSDRHEGLSKPTMEAHDNRTQMTNPSMTGPAQVEPGKLRVLVELRVPKGQEAAAREMAADLSASSFQVDRSYQPVPMVSPKAKGESLASVADGTVVVRGTIDEAKLAALEAQANVVKVWRDPQIAPFEKSPMRKSKAVIVKPVPAFGPCAIPPCDCDPGTPKGAIADVALYLGVDQIWSSGVHGEGIVVGIVDGGITAAGRVSGGTIPRVIGGWPSDWGTVARWGGHGNMTSTDALGMAPQAQVYDLRISDGDAVSNALSAFQWAIDQHRADGTPHVLSNSWGIFQEAWDPGYARDPDHPFTRKVVEALDEGILVLFAAGNCGDTCPDGRCDTDVGPGRSIWGANGHTRVMTVAAVNKDEQYVGYSSAGPAALDPHKPDFCSITHFTGFFTSDSGTSAATPIAAGVVALLKQGNPALTQDAAKGALMSTAKDIGAPGWDQYSGAGIIQGKAAFDAISRPSVWNDWESLGGYCLSGVATASWAFNRLDSFVIGADHAMYHKWWDGVQWNDWENLGGYCLNGPGAVSWGPNRIDTFVIGSDNAMYHKWWDGVQWSDWENLGGYCLSGVAAASWAANRLDCFVIGSDHAMYHKWWDGVQWNDWENLGGYCLDGPGAVSWGPNRIDTFVIGSDNAMYHKWWG
jgi:serine protease AprX